MNPPTSAGFARLATVLHRSGRRFAPGQEAPHPRVRAMVTQLAGITVRNRGAALPVEQYAVVADREDAGKLVCDYHDGRAQAVAQLQDQVVKPARGDRIEAG